MYFVFTSFQHGAFRFQKENERLSKILNFKYQNNILKQTNGDNKEMKYIYFKFLITHFFILKSKYCFFNDFYRFHNNACFLSFKIVNFFKMAFLPFKIVLTFRFICCWKVLFFNIHPHPRFLLIK